MRSLSAILIACALVMTGVEQTSATTIRLRTAATYVADCNSADEEREEACLTTFMSAIMEDRMGPAAVCSPSVSDDKVYQQALKAAAWLRTHPDNLKLDEFAGVRLAQWSLWACKR
jgi:hypothetical protein